MPRIGPTPGSFKKGQTGNPKGRPKEYAHVKELARQHTTEAIAALVAALKNKGERVPAAQALLDRGWGKPSQPIAGEDGNPIAVSGITVTFVRSPQCVVDAEPQQITVSMPENGTD